MTLLHFDGFDIGDIGTRYVCTGNMVTTTTTRFGVGRSLELQNSGTMTMLLPSAATELYVGYYFEGNTGIHLQFAEGSASNPQIMVGWLDASTFGVWNYYASATGMPSAAVPYVGGYIEVRLLCADSGGRLVVKLNGTTIIDWTGDTKTSPLAGTGAIDRLYIARNAAGLFRYDDLYVCNAVDATATQGAPNNTFLGDVRVVPLNPTGAGASTGFTPSTGANWAAVDERPPSATDYVQGAVGAKDTYVMSDLPGSIASVIAVQSVAVAKKTDAGTISLRNIIRAAGTDYPGASVSLGTNDVSITDLWAKNPNTGALWTPSEVNGIEAGMEAV